MPRFSRLKLKNRIFFGFSAIGAVALLIVVVSVLTINNVFANFQRFTAFAQQVETGQELSAGIVELQRLTDQYTVAGHGFAASQAEHAFQRASELLRQLEAGERPEIVARARVIRRHLEAFHDAFLEVKYQRGQQSRLVEEVLPAHAAYCESLISDYQTHLVTTHPGQMATAERLENAILQIERNADRYFDRLDSALVRRIKDDVALSRSYLAELSAGETHGGNDDALNLIDVSLHQYQSAILEAVQRTRGYLYLVNVVMAAETSEILYQSSRLSEELKSEMGQIEQQMAGTIREAGTHALMAGAVTLLLIVGLSYLIGRSIAAPIEELAGTFRKLARGDSDVGIKADPSNDELAELTAAARVFDDKNRETQRLLEQYRDLSEDLEERVNARTRELERVNHQLEVLSRTDGLTGLANRRYFEEVMALEWSMSARSSMCLAVIMLDVDMFKPFNDLYGHQAGDDCLRIVARTLEQSLYRKTDFAARYGGEEFVLILQDTDHKGALEMAEKLRLAVSERGIPHRGSAYGVVTVSIGVAVHTPHDSLAGSNELIRLADSALYKSKESGRNRVTCLDPDRPE